MPYKNQNGYGVASLINYKLVDSQSLLLNGKRHYRGVAPYPVTPNVGDTWEELNISGLWVESWFWNGNYWLSTTVYSESLSFENALYVSAASPVFFEFPVDLTFDIFLKQFLVASIQDSTGTSTNYWEFTLNRTIPNNNYVTLATLNTIGTIGNRMASLSIAIAIHVNVTVTQLTTFKIIRTRRAGGSSIASAVKFEYYKARK